MKHPKTNRPKTRSLHPRNLHQGRYDMGKLSTVSPELKAFLMTTPDGQLSIDFHNAPAVVALNRALLKTYYGIGHWDLPEGALCPPIPGRSDYIHYLADLLKDRYGIRSPKNANVRVLDIGTGASLIYPILGRQLYGWSFVGSEVEPASIKAAQTLIDNNESLTGCIEVRQQTDRSQIFTGLIAKDEVFHLTLCNPPFHATEEAARQGTQRKVNNLNRGHLNRTSAASLNFGGQANELWCPGGEPAFVSNMMHESRAYARQVGWFTCLVSKAEHLPMLKKTLKKLGVTEFKVVTMSQGQKVSRFIGWTFWTRDELTRHAPLTLTG